jgi:hypothetical protein
LAPSGVQNLAFGASPGGYRAKEYRNPVPIDVPRGVPEFTATSRNRIDGRDGRDYAGLSPSGVQRPARDEGSGVSHLHDPTSRNRIDGRDYAGLSPSGVRHLARDEGSGVSHLRDPTSRNRIDGRDYARLSPSGAHYLARDEGPGASHLHDPTSRDRIDGRDYAGLSPSGVQHLARDEGPGMPRLHDSTSRNRIVGRDYAGPSPSGAQHLARDDGPGVSRTHDATSHSHQPRYATSRNEPGAQNVSSAEQNRRECSHASAGVQDHHRRHGEIHRMFGGMGIIICLLMVNVNINLIIYPATSASRHVQPSRTVLQLGGQTF